MVPVIFQNLPAASLQISLLTFHIHFTFLLSHNSQISSHNTFSQMRSINFFTLQLCFKIAPLICFVCRATYNFFIIALK
jgi:hypothetical protein